MSYITVSLPFNTNSDTAKRLLSTAWLFKVATHRVLDLARQAPVLPATDIGWRNTFRSVAYEVIPNRRYADGAITLVRSIYESCRVLGVDFRGVELDDWLMFQQSEMEYPVRNVTLREDYEFHITVIDYGGSASRVIIKPTIPKNYRLLLDKILEERQEHTGRVVINGYGVRGNTMWVHGEIQLTIPIEFYYKHMTRYRQNNGKLFGGVDVNADRINLVIVDKDGRLRDIKTFWFEEASRKGVTRHRARSIIGMAVHEMLGYAYHHGVKTLFLENPDILGRLKLMWIRSGDRRHENYNWKKAIFRNSVIEMIAMKAPLYGINVEYVNPKGTTSSEEHDEVMRRYGLDRHAASAYLIALKGLKQP